MSAPQPATLPRPRPRAEAALRDEGYMSLPVADAPEQHYRSVQLATCSQPRAVTSVDLSVDWMPGDGCIYVCLCVQIPFLPFLQPHLMHITVGQYTATRRTPVLELCEALQGMLRTWRPMLDTVHLRPLSRRSLHFGISQSTPFYLLVLELQQVMRQYRCRCSFEPVPHISWAC